MQQIKKKLLFVNGHLNVGGIEKSLLDLLCNLDYTKYGVDLLLLERPGDYITQLPSDVRVIFRDTTKIYGSLLHTIVSCIKDRRFSDVVFRLILYFSRFFGYKIYRSLLPLLHIADYYDCAVAYRVGFSSDIVSYAVKSKKKVCWWHNGECNYNVDQIKHINDSWKNMDYVVSVSNGCRDLIIRNFDFPADHIKVIPNIVDVSKINIFAGNSSPYTDNGNILKIITVGRLCWEKHIEDIPDIANNLVREGYDRFKWYIIGDGDKEQEIRDKIAQNHYENQIILLGKKINPYPYIKFADMLVHTSHVESQCITILEAMALKTPCVVCESIGPKDFIKSGVNGILTKQNVIDMTSGIIEMIHKIPHSGLLVKNGYETVCHSFSPKIILSYFDSLIN
ncbi:MAG: glycosyltransferase [Phocaeicola sp.]|uniref:glycosyltransferase n=1 Tax=Phocaeicola sp. TaxID=2773926 RepID=UPI003F9F191F